MYVLFNLFHTGNNNGNCIGNCKGVIAGNGNGNDNHSDKPSGNNNGNCIGKESIAYKHIYHCSPSFLPNLWSKSEIMLMKNAIF